MSKLLRNVLIGAAIALGVSLLFGFIGGAVHSEEIATSGQYLAAALGILSFFILQTLIGTRRSVPADAEARARALSFTCPPDRALVYFVRTNFAGKAVGVNIEIDGKTVAQIKSPRFTCVELPPGAHELKAWIGGSALNPDAAQISSTLPAGSITLLHIGLRRRMLKTQLVFEPWTLDVAKTRLGKIGMVSPAI